MPPLSNFQTQPASSWWMPLTPGWGPSFHSATHKLHPCAYFSRWLLPAQRNYVVGSRELVSQKSPILELSPQIKLLLGALVSFSESIQLHPLFSPGFSNVEQVLTEALLSKKKQSSEPSLFFLFSNSSSTLSLPYSLWMGVTDLTGFICSTNTVFKSELRLVLVIRE